MEWPASIAALDLQLVCHFWMTEPIPHDIPRLAALDVTALYCYLAYCNTM
jgi:hypothetical protein